MLCCVRAAHAESSSPSRVARVSVQYYYCIRSTAMAILVYWSGLSMYSICEYYAVGDHASIDETLETAEKESKEQQLSESCIIYSIYKHTRLELQKTTMQRTTITIGRLLSGRFVWANTVTD